uniref:Peptidoglycan-recognition protein n=1 Tax=Physocyclus mexicanus TaxID=1705800 RepID=A0A6B9KEA6_9ARAC|nr:peptidoglycan recognition protein SC2 [Physocyclus mexicanus]
MKRFLILGFVFSLLSISSGCPEIVDRKAWGARPSTNPKSMSTPVDHVFIHHTEGAECTTKDKCIETMKQIQNYHMNSRKYADIGYSFLVGGDGRIYEGRGWNKVGAHTYGYNSRAIAISFMGNYEKTAPSETMLNAAKKLIDCGVSKGFIKKERQIHGHKDANCTTCPGESLYNAIKSWTGFKGGKLPGYKCKKNA